MCKAMKLVAYKIRNQHDEDFIYEQMTQSTLEKYCTSVFIKVIEHRFRKRVVLKELQENVL